MILRTGFQTFEFHEGREIRFGSREDALNWLKGLGLPDADLMVRLRGLLAQHAGDADSTRLPDYQVLEHLAAMLYSRRIAVIGRQERASSGAPTPSTAPAAPAFPLSERAPAAAAAAPPPPANDPSTFGPNAAAAAQASALVAAAAAGTPFCAECTNAAGSAN